MARGFTPRQTGDATSDAVQNDLRQAVRELGQVADTSANVTTFVESRVAQPGDALLAFKGPTGQTLTLAPAHLPQAGKLRRLLVLNFATVALTIAAPSGNTIDGGTSISLGAGKAATIYTDGETKALSIIAFTTADIPAAPADAADYGSFKHIPAGGGLTMHYCANVTNSGPLTGITKSLTNDLMYAVPFVAPQRGGTLDRIQFEYTANALLTTTRVCIYASTSDSNLYPAAKVVEGTITTPGGAGIYTVTVSAPLTGGKLYWAVINSPGGGVAARGVPPGQCSHVLGTTSTPSLTPNTHLTDAASASTTQPDPFGAGGTLITTVAPALWVRIS